MILSTLALALAGPYAGPYAVPQSGSVHAVLHPQDAEFYVELPDAQALGRATAAAPLFQLAQDASIENLLVLAGEPDVETVGDAIAMAWEDADIPAPMRELLLASAKDIRSASFSVSGARPHGDRVQREIAALARVESELISIDALCTALASSPDGGPPATLSELAARGDISELDPWGNPYLYELEEGRNPVVTSLGSDGAPGGAYSAADLTVWSDFSTRRALSFASELELLIVLDFADAATATGLTQVAIGALMGMVDMEEMTDGDKSVRTLSSPLATELQGWMVTEGGRITLGLGTGSEEAFAARTPETSLASSPSFARATGPLGDVGGPALLLVQGNASYQELRGLQELAKFEAGESKYSDESVDTIAELVGVFEGPFSDWAIRCAGAEGGFQWRSFSTDQAYGGGAPSSVTQAGVSAGVPADAIFAWAAPLDLEPLLGLAELLPGDVSEPLEAWLATSQGEDGDVDFGRDLLANVGPRMLAFSPPPSGIAAPRAQLWLELHDAPRFQAAWTRFIEGLPPLGDGFELRIKSYKGIDYTQLRTPQSMVAPCFSLIGDRLLVTLDSRTFKSVAKEMAKGDAGAGELPAALQARREELEEANSWLLLDWGNLLGGYYGTARTMAGLAGDSLPVPIDQLPPADIFSKYLRPTVSVTRVHEGGVLTVRDSSFGPMGWMTPVALGAGAVWVVPMAMAEMGGGGMVPR